MKHAPWTPLGTFQLTAVLGLLAACLCTGVAADAEKVSAQEGKTVVLENGSRKPLKEKLALTPSIEVRTNATYVVNGGTPRKLDEGAVLDRQGMLTSPNGTVRPVFDHITMHNGQVIVFKDGQTTTPQGDLALPSGLRINPRGEMHLPNGRLQRLLDGQILDLSGNAVMSRDTVTLRDGKVFVQKDGTQIELRPNQTLMMNDGTKVFADGHLVKRSGDAITLSEGQIVQLEGIVSANR